MELRAATMKQKEDCDNFFCKPNPVQYFYFQFDGLLQSWCVCVCRQKPQFGPAGDDYAKPKQKPKPKALVQAAPVPGGPCQRAPVEVKEEEGDSEWQVPKRHAKKQKQKNKGG